MNPTRLHCPAKINLALSVGAPRADGMHPIASWMAALTFGDELCIAPGDGGSTFDIAFNPGRGDVDWPLESDLAFRAHAAMQSAAGRPLPVQVTLRKNIPAGAGLGGGSSDAAAVIVALNDLFDLNMPTADLAAIGLTLGSDVGFLVHALRGTPSALVTGVGETIEPLPIAAPIDLVLIFPGFGSPTGAVYQAFDAAGPQGDADVARVRDVALRSPLPPDAPFNDLAAPACTVSPKLAALRDDLSRHLDRPIHITGSGSTLFTITASTAEAVDLAAGIGPHAVATRTRMPRDARI